MVCLAAGLAGMALHGLIWRDRRRLVADQATLVWLAIVVNVGHIFVYGWPLGFPLPGPTLLFLPFIASIFLLWQSILLFFAAIAAIRAPQPPNG